MFQATTRVAILRTPADGATPGDERTDALGDPLIDNGEDAIVDGLSDVPAGLTERSRSVWDPSTMTRRTVRVVTCRLPVATPHPDTGERVAMTLLEGDRIKDNTTGRVYALSEQTTVPRSLAGMSSLTLDLKYTANGA